ALFLLSDGQTPLALRYYYGVEIEVQHSTPAGGKRDPRGTRCRAAALCDLHPLPVHIPCPGNSERDRVVVVPRHKVRVRDDYRPAFRVACLALRLAPRAGCIAYRKNGLTGK